MPDIPTNKVVDKGKNNWKKEGRGGGETQGVAGQKIIKAKACLLH
jgi:hypothetical protein